MKNIFEMVGIGIMALLFVGMLAWGMNRQEVVECNQWKEQANQFAGFYLAKWQKEQCDAHKVEVGAKVISEIEQHESK